MTVPLPQQPIGNFFWIFMPPPNRTWHMTIHSFRQALLRRNPDEFTRIWVPRGGLTRGVVMSFGFTLDDESIEAIEGIASSQSEGASIEFATVDQAVEFVGWLGQEIVPPGEPIQVSTREGIETGVEDVIVDDVRPEPLRDVLLDHVVSIATLNGYG